MKRKDLIAGHIKVKPHWLKDVMPSHYITPNNEFSFIVITDKGLRNKRRLRSKWSKIKNRTTFKLFIQS